MNANWQHCPLPLQTSRLQPSPCTTWQWVAAGLHNTPHTHAHTSPHQSEDYTTSASQTSHPKGATHQTLAMWPTRCPSLEQQSHHHSGCHSTQCLSCKDQPTDLPQHCPYQQGQTGWQAHQSSCHSTVLWRQRVGPPRVHPWWPGHQNGCRD